MTTKRASYGTLYEFSLKCTGRRRLIWYQEGKENLTGFIAEAWHIRYVGVEHARIIRDHNWCLEEYLEAMERDRPDEEETLTIEEDESVG